MLTVDMVSGEMCSAAPFSVGFNHQQVTVPTVAKWRRDGERWRENSPEHQCGNRVINYLRRRPWYRENLGALADLCLPSLLAHQGVRSGQSNLGDPAGRKQEGHFVCTHFKAIPCMCDKGNMVAADEFH